MPSKNTSAHIAEVVAAAGKIDAQQTHRSLEFVSQVAETLRSMREIAGLKQDQLAEKLGVTQGRISQIESGLPQHAPSLEMVSNYASACGQEIQIALKGEQHLIVEEAALKGTSSEPVVFVDIVEVGAGAAFERRLQELDRKRLALKPISPLKQAKTHMRMLKISGKAARNILKQVKTAGAGGDV